MSWLHDPEKDEYFSRVDEELTAAGYTATPGGRRATRIILLVWFLLLAFGAWLLLKPEAPKDPADLGYAAAELQDHEHSDGEPASP